MTTPRDILVYARNEVAKGWIQGGFDNSRGVCALGGVGRARAHFYALDEALGGVARRAHAIGVAALRVQIPDKSVSTWNDEDGRTQEEVLELFDRAIATLPGRSKEIDVPDPQQVPEPDRIIHVDPIQTPAPVDPVPEPAPEPVPEREPEKVPA